MPWDKQFDQNETLELAMRAFWSGGYEGTSMTELLESMGIQKGSFYATYGSKHQVLIDALEAYVQDRFERFEAILDEPSPRTALENHLREIAADASGSGHNLGCFVVNMAIEQSPKDDVIRSFVLKTFERHEGLYRKLLESAKAKGEVSATLDPRSVARGLLASVIGMRVVARAGVKPIVIESIRDQAMRLLK